MAKLNFIRIVTKAILVAAARNFLFALMALVGLPTVTFAVPIADPQSSNNTQFFAGNVSNSDLIEGNLGTYSGFSTSTGHPTNLNDGLHGDDSVSGIAWVQSSGAVATWNLGLGDNGLGYDITSIRSIAAWGSADFDNQLYDIHIKKVGEVSFSPLYSVSLLTPSSSGSTQFTLTDSTGVLASGVVELQFQFSENASTLDGNSTTFREIDIFGFSTTPIPAPEPSTLLLLVIGTVGVIRRAQRRAKA